MSQLGQFGVRVNVILAKRKDFLFSLFKSLIQVERLQLTAVQSVSQTLSLFITLVFITSGFYVCGFFFFAFALLTCSFFIVTFFFCPVSLPPTNKDDTYLLVVSCTPLQCTKHAALKQLSRLENDKPFTCTFTYPHCWLFSLSLFPKMTFKIFASIFITFQIRRVCHIICSNCHPGKFKSNQVLLYLEELISSCPKLLQWHIMDPIACT